MPKICYDPDTRDRIRKNPDRMAIVDKANEFIELYQDQGLMVSLRQLYYRFVAAALIPNKDTEYKRLGNIIGEARLAGLIDWEALEDRGRFLRELPHWEDPSSIMRAVASQFRIDKWAEQDWRVEVWIEKDALVGVLENPCNELDVPYFSCRGYTSLTEVWNAAMRIKAHTKAGQRTMILHFGDHDPSGIDMSRDIRDRLQMFTGGRIQLKRMALNMDQVEEYNPPPNPAKLTDSRAQGYIANFGDESWELDALEPTVIANLIRTAVTELRDAEKWEQATEEEDRHKEDLQLVSDRWDAVVERVRGEDEDAHGN